MSLGLARVMPIFRLDEGGFGDRIVAYRGATRYQIDLGALWYYHGRGPSIAVDGIGTVYALHSRLADLLAQIVTANVVAVTVSDRTPSVSSGATGAGLSLATASGAGIALDPADSAWNADARVFGLAEGSARVDPVGSLWVSPRTTRFAWVPRREGPRDRRHVRVSTPTTEYVEHPEYAEVVSIEREMRAASWSGEPGGRVLLGGAERADYASAAGLEIGDDHGCWEACWRRWVDAGAAVVTWDGRGADASGKKQLLALADAEQRRDLGATAQRSGSGGIFYDVSWVAVALDGEVYRGP